MAIDKVLATPAEAVAQIRDGSRLGMAGFGISHRYPMLVPALLQSGAKGLTVVANSLGAPTESLADLIAASRVAHLIVSFTTRAEEQVASGEVSFELVPQGTLVERLRAAGSGIPAFYTRTGVGTPVAEGKELRSFSGEEYLLESALPLDVAFIRATRADRFGNLFLHGTGRNFNLAFAKAAKVVIAEVDEIVPGALDPDEVHLPGIFVTHVVRQEPRASVTFPAQRRGRDAEVPVQYLGRPGWTRLELAEVAASLLPEPSYVNLGLGIPTLMSNFIAGRDVVLHSENGMLGYGEEATAEDFDPDVMNAGGGFVHLLEGASFFDSVASFEMIRSGRIDVVALGGLQVDAEANLANWTTGQRPGGGIGGAMDLANGARSVMVLMTHLGPNGEQKLVEHCTYPLTGRGCVEVVVTDLAVLRRVGGQFLIERTAPGFQAEEIAELTEMRLAIAR
jgi:3-oxoacid CoA-transferase